jgi:SAM-dependent methyltransferase
MHQSAMDHGKLFFDTYLRGMASPRILDVGALDINGSLRTVAPAGAIYVGADFAEGKGVDVMMTDPYHLPFPDGSFDVSVSSSCFEHSEFFWLSFTESLRILRPGGLLYVNSPANGWVHRHPVDCWRFYPDAGRAMERWGLRQGLSNAMVESFIGAQTTGEMWNDFVAVFVRDAARAADHPNRMLDTKLPFTNGLRLGSDILEAPEVWMEDQRSISAKGKRLFGRVARKLG